MSLPVTDSAAEAELARKLDEALFETGERTRSRMSRSSLRCYWRRPLGHRWEFREPAGKPMLRCAGCGKVSRGPRGWVDMRDDPNPGLARVKDRGDAAGTGGEAGGGAGAGGD